MPVEVDESSSATAEAAATIVKDAEESKDGPSAAGDVDAANAESHRTDSDGDPADADADSDDIVAIDDDTISESTAAETARDDTLDTTRTDTTTTSSSSNDQDKTQRIANIDTANAVAASQPTADAPENTKSALKPASPHEEAASSAAAPSTKKKAKKGKKSAKVEKAAVSTPPTVVTTASSENDIASPLSPSKRNLRVSIEASVSPRPSNFTSRTDASRSPHSPSSTRSTLISPRPRTTEEITAFWPSGPISMSNINSLSPKSARQPQLTNISRLRTRYFDALYDHIANGTVTSLTEAIAAFPIDMRCEMVNSTDDNGNSLLFYTLQPERNDFMTTLVEFGADVNIPNHALNTAMHIASLYSYKKAIKYLIENAAFINKENKEHQQPHQMHKTQDKAIAMQQYINTTMEQHQTNISEKLYFIIDRNLRSYYRSLYAIATRNGTRWLTIQNIQHMIDVVQSDLKANGTMPLINIPLPPAPVASANANTAATPTAAAASTAASTSDSNSAPVAAYNEWTFKWFTTIDTNHDGIISFDEFIYAITLMNIEKDKANKKKNKKGGKASKKK